MDWLLDLEGPISHDASHQEEGGGFGGGDEMIADVSLSASTPLANASFEMNFPTPPRETKTVKQKRKFKLLDDEVSCLSLLVSR